MSDLQLKHTLSDNGQTLHISVSGRLGIDTVSELHVLLQEQLPNALKLSLDLSLLEQLDLTGAQLICSACQTAVTSGKSFNFTHMLSDSLRQTITNLGLHRIATCIHTPDHTCIWCGGIN